MADSGDTAWMLAATLLMIGTTLPGLVLRMAGESAEAIRDAAARALAGIALLSIGWTAIGYSLAFSDGTQLLGGADMAWLANLAELRVDTTIPESSFVLYQLAVALTAATLIISPMINRARFGWGVALAALWTLCVYVPVAHWLWGSGWLSALSAHDFAGGVVVNVSAGASALVIALMLKSAPIEATTESSADSPSGLIGGGLIWVGWLAAAGGAALTASDDASAAIINVLMSAAASALVWALLAQLRDKIVAAESKMSGALAGLAAAVASAGYIGPAGATALGAIASGAAFTVKALLGIKLRQGDRAAVILWGVSAGIGALLFPVFVPILGGPGFEPGVTLAGQILAQAIAAGAVATWSAIVTLIMGLGITLIVPMQTNVAESA